MTLRSETSFAHVALEHLAMVDEHTALPELRLHCHFAKLFLQLALEEKSLRRYLEIVEIAE